jgi:predicted metal-dependent hydrolase
MSEAIPEPVLDSAVVRGIEKGVAEFNAGKFFECHDTLEEIWQGIRGPARDFFQGLIQISVGFYHLRNGNLRGGESQLEKGLKALRRYGDRYAGMELGNLRGEVERWLERVRAGENLRANVADLPKYDFTPPSQG